MLEEQLMQQSPDLAAENVRKLAELFPSVVADGRVNCEMLRTLLGEKVMGTERYEFTLYAVKHRPSVR